MTEDIRLNNNGTYARRCACKGFLIGPMKDTVTMPIVGDIVRDHQSKEPHKSWQAAAWVQNNTLKADVPIAKLKKIA